ncbi:Alpha/Beta hydrolase protein [Mycena vulgaris]|nr:Alpha/Beta hydrolase protein [Mycena vulgaris]
MKRAGYYLASHGIIAVLPNYRLVPDVQYPGGGDDVQLVREWVHANIAQTEYGHGDAGKVVFIGQSSGASHIATNLYAAGDSTKPVRDPLHPPLAGVVYLSAPFFFDASKARRAQTLCEYYGSDDPAVVLPLSPAGLLSSLPADSPVLNPRVLPTLMLVAQYDPCVSLLVMLFFNTYRERSRPVGMLPLFRVLPGHNHITNVLSVGTADDAQGRILTEFIEECVRV